MYTVLIADDEEELRKAVIQKVDWESAGFTVVGEAENGAEALELIEQLGPDLLITDIKMPFVSGIELARQAREIRPSMQIAFLSGYDDFQFAQKAIQYNIISYMLKPISASELTEEMKVIKEKIDQKFEELKGTNLGYREDRIRQLEQEEFLMPIFMDAEAPFAKSAEDLEPLEKKAVELGIRKNIGEEFQYIVVVTLLEDDKKKNKTGPEHANFVSQILKKYVTSSSFYSRGKIVTLISATARNIHKYLHILSMEVIQSAERILDLKCAMGVSHQFDQLTFAGAAYEEAVAAIQYVDEESEVQFISDISPEQAIKYEGIEETVAKLDHLIKTGERWEIERFLMGLFEEMEEDQTWKCSIDFLMVQILSCVYRTVNMASEPEAAAEFLRKCSIWKEDDDAGTNESIKQKVIQICVQARNQISSQRKANSEVICDRVLRLIDEEYSDASLSVAVVSDKLHVSASYLSAIIKKNTGETFVSLLTRKRMEKAKEYLLCTSLKVLEISKQCGYSEQHYFSYCFKRFYGLSPNKMREEAAKAELI